MTSPKCSGTKIGKAEINGLKGVKQGEVMQPGIFATQVP